MLVATDATFKSQVLEAKEPVLVDFWAEWCGPCKMLMPILEELAKEVTTVKIVKLNIDQNPQTAGQLSIRSVPTLLLFKDGKVASTLIGLNPKQKIKSWIDSNI